MPGGTEAFEPLQINSHRALAARMGEITVRFNARADLAAMLFINPALTFKDLGVSLSPELVHHILYSTQHPPALRKRREELEVALEQALEETPHPDDPKWVSELLFGKLELKPLETAGQQPAYLPPLAPEFIDRLKMLRPKARVRYPGKRALRRVSSVTVFQWHPTVRRMDLAAPLPELRRAGKAPSEVSLEELYFYKDSHPIARQMLELGIIQRRSFPFHSPDAYRQIRDRKKPNAFRAWIRSVRFPSTDP